MDSRFFRKQRHPSPDRSVGGPSSIHSPNASSSPLAALSRSSIDPVDNSADNPRGTLGLTLLYSPPSDQEPQIDFIFVHGLGGGSRKTWSKTSQRSHYWPQEWLPQDPAFKNVRIHSYGYDSDYMKGREDCLNVHHIGKSFLGAISTSPCLASSGSRIISIGHSMGGLVIKKAYLLAKQDPAHKVLAGRFAAIYFLATPHRGADSAKTLKNVLKVAYDRAYVADLERNSGAIQVINDEFRHCSVGLELWSFYETLHMKMFSSPIVDPESAVLGYREEKQIPMNADHRSICKFETPLDPNYIILRNALASTVDNILVAIPGPRLKEERDRIKDLRKYLDVSNVLDDDLLSACEARTHESCQWITTKDGYVRWRDSDSGNDRTLWVKGKPGTGKSVLAGFVVDNLRESGHACSYFFFKHGDQSKSSLGHCLRSLAFQMASLNTEIGDTLLKMQAYGSPPRLDHGDERTLWRLLFLFNIFRPTMTRHYWVIDALDECSSSPALFDAILSDIDESVPLRIIITSRDTVDLGPDFSGIPSSPVQSLSMSTEDTQFDLRLLIERRALSLGVVGAGDRAPLAEKILGKSKGSFLWTTLVLKELLRCHSKKDIDRILEEVPRGMESLYKRILDSMSQASRGKELAKAILAWVTCVVRPLKVSELDGALGLDIEDSFPRLEESISALCGDLVVVDRFGRVQMVHETAREFLLSGGFDSEFSIDTSKAHTRMAEVCLTYLVGEELKPPRATQRRLPAARMDFAAYAYTAYSYHLSKADPAAGELFRLVGQFFKSNVLAWIEMVAESRDLYPLIRASKHLKTFVNACAAERPPLDPHIQMLRQWVVDLIRIPAMFADALTTSPAAVYSVIPPFCPTGSMIYNTSRTARRLAVLGTSNEKWDDRFMCIDLLYSSALCYGEEFLAVSLSAGSVVLFHATSCQKYKVLDHGEKVLFIAFKTNSDLMATCSLTRGVKIWDIQSGEVVRSLESPGDPWGMDFNGNSLMVTSHDGSDHYVASWDLGQDAEYKLVQMSWSETPMLNLSSLHEHLRAVTLSISHGILVAAYDSQSIIMWDMEDGAYVGSCGKKFSDGEPISSVVCLAFNPNPNIDLLAVTYTDGDLVLLDPFANQQLECSRDNCGILAPSPNGRLLAAGGELGSIKIYEFDTLRLRCQVRPPDVYVRDFCFSRDSSRLADIRFDHCNVWEPEALMRGSLSDNGSGTSSTSVAETETISIVTKAMITTMEVHPTAEVVFCGKNDGTVATYDDRTGVPLQTLYKHEATVHLLAWCQQMEALLSIDTTDMIWLHGIQKSADRGWSVDVTATVVFQCRLKEPLGRFPGINNVLVGEAVGKFVVSTSNYHHLFSLNNGEYEMGQACDRAAGGIRKLIPHPRSSPHLISVDSDYARIYCWADLSEVGTFPLYTDIGGTLYLGNATPYSLGQESKIILGLFSSSGTAFFTVIADLDMDCLVSGSNGTSPSPDEPFDAAAASDEGTTDQDRENIITTTPHPITTIVPKVIVSNQGILRIIGVTNAGRLVFLDRSSWVCSVDLCEGGGLEAGQGGDTPPPTVGVFRHFFVPHDWFAGVPDPVFALAQGDVILTRGGGELAIIRGGLEHAERVLSV